MSNVWQMIWAGLAAIWLPVAVLLGGALVMRFWSGHSYVDRRLRDRAAPRDRMPLYMRLLGYDRDAVARQWGALDEQALQSERKFLQLDLGFPLLYGPALAIALWQAWTASGRPFSAVIPIAMVAITMISDWTENRLQLTQLRLFVQHGKEAMQPGQIRIASAATIVKLLLFAGTLLLTAILAAAREVQ